MEDVIKNAILSGARGDRTVEADAHIRLDERGEDVGIIGVIVAALVLTITMLSVIVLLIKS